MRNMDTSTVREKVLCMSKDGKRIGYTRKKQPSIIDYETFFKKISPSEKVIPIYTTYKDSTCSICCDNIDNNGVYITKCNHTFHLDCILSWYYKNTSCPMCRTEDIHTPFGTPPNK